MSTCAQCNSKLTPEPVCPRCFAPTSATLTSTELEADLASLLTDRSTVSVPRVEGLGSVTFAPISRWRHLARVIGLALLAMVLALSATHFVMSTLDARRYDAAVTNCETALEYHKQENFEEAERIWRDSLHTFLSFQDVESQLETYVSLAKNAIGQEQFPKAIAYIGQAADLPGDEHDDRLKKLLQETNLNYGLVALRTGIEELYKENWEQALWSGEEALHFLHAADAPTADLAKGYRLIGHSQWKLGHLLSATDSLTAALSYEEDEQVRALLTSLKPKPKEPIRRTVRPKEPPREPVHRPVPVAPRPARQYTAPSKALPGPAAAQGAYPAAPSAQSDSISRLMSGNKDGGRMKETEPSQEATVGSQEKVQRLRSTRAYRYQNAEVKRPTLPSFPGY